jgi:F0F1-type ATP synthase assembly protein I
LDKTINLSGGKAINAGRSSATATGFKLSANLISALLVR